MASPCPHCGSTDGVDHLCGGASLALLGTVLDGRYKIESVLGQGGMGMVFRATQTSVQRPVAVKTLNPALAAAPTFFERFRREAEVASRLRHPNVITIYDFGRAQDNTCYYVMELLEGESLKEIVKRDGPMSLRRAVNIMEQAARGLAHAHAENCVHRDLKPHNIMVQQLDGKDFVKVLDFGLVKALEQEEEEQLTSTGQVLGTPQYMPPEQAGGEVVDQRSDLYSLTGVLYYCLTGTSPYGANTVRKALTAALTQTVPPVNSKRQGAPVSAELDAFMQKGLAREKEDRFQSAEEFIDAMLDAVADLSPEQMDARPSGGATAREGGSGSRPSGVSGARKSPGSASSARPSKASANSNRSAPSNVIVSRSAVGSAPSASRPRASGGTSQRAPAPPPPAPPPPEPPAGMSTGMKAGIIGGALLLLLGGGAVVVLRPGGSESTATTPTQVVEVPREQPVRPAPTKPPPETPQPSAPTISPTVAVKINSSPSGAGIFNEEGTQIGTTPTSLVLSRDKTHKLKLQLQGYQDAERPLNLGSVADNSVVVDVPLSPVRTATPSKPKPPKQGGGDKSDITIFE
ncbi:serine/threonine protein kinase [Hyalangium rubrum]|uniref:Protein kinase n=1 Tax=Hyalangium rubrum TaxID=3103134 RepID=A0ABU5HBC9_9BACT|nr:protein kinase [Hyalangium sp. s54d21]MDY7230636.1 protein kinase [Hyalangium sp. s54d21]